MPALKAATARDGKGNTAEVSSSLLPAGEGGRRPVEGLPAEPILQPPPRRRGSEPITERGKNLLARQAQLAREAIADSQL
jgi:hypothetical protein